MNVRSILSLLAFVIYLPAQSQMLEGKNMVKVNLSSFVGKGFGLQYERQIGKRFTVALGYSKIPTSNIAFKSFIENQIDDPDIKIGDFKLGTSIFTPEVRYYVGKRGAFHGFYLAPYGRFGRYNLQGPITYTTSTNAKRDLVFTGSLNATTGGLMLGSSFTLHKRLYLDWWIVGGSIGSANGNFIAQTALSESEQRSLREELESIDVAFTSIKSTVTSTGATITTSGSMAGVRGLGINLGIRF
ncbi:DUF3575 domain-containing protein [Segetibacter aerophilus]|uniref:DUF3575 domain-containing protein n=1 Tax=Segetibacter aerophilus TaxID=670293 RepID=A0A512B7I1_9BACT|nr:DUF3575 domain-containing protein [Segetibacter aerophilus]GEO07916.1 hypothetical protein SAE01_04120 [Segetibacter aerophilus]